MSNRFDEWSSEIKSYCQKNNLDFDKAKKLSQGWGKDFLVLQFHDENIKANGLLDEIPMPVVLIIEKKDNNLIFTQTEHTKKYL
ncbi:MAG: hypothetical protein PUG48_10605 [Clostridia bacterium]|nr:hypothetical protein [Clostridia bacterium]